MKEATWAGAKAAVVATVISGGVIMAGVHFLPRFGKALGTSARTALIVRGRQGQSMCFGFWRPNAGGRRSVVVEWACVQERGSGKATQMPSAQQHL